MFYYEMKKLIFHKRFYCAFAIAMLSCILIFLFLLQQQVYYKQDGSYIRGYDALHALQKQRSLNENVINDTSLQTVFRHYQSIFADPAHLDEYQTLKPQAYAKWQRYSSIGDVLVRAYSSLQSNNAKYLTAMQTQEITTKQLLHQRERLFTTYLSMFDAQHAPLFSSAEKARLLTLFHTFPDTKASYSYHDASLWQLLLQQSDKIHILCFLMSVLLSASLFSKEKQLETAPLLYTTKKGRTQDIAWKLLAVLVALTLVFLLLHGLFFLLASFCFHMQGASDYIQFQAPYFLSVFPFTNLQAYGFVLGVGYLGCISIAILSVVFSCFTKKEYISLLLSLLTLFLPAIFAHSYPVFPWDMKNGNLQLMSFSIQDILQLPLLHIELQGIITCLLLCAMLVIMYGYRKGYFLT